MMEKLDLISLKSPFFSVSFSILFHHHNEKIIQKQRNYLVIQFLFIIGFLDDKNTLDDINEILALMSAPELQSLAKSLQLSKNGKGEKLVKKKDLKNAIINLGYSQKDILSFFSPNSKHSMMNSIIKRYMIGESLSIGIL